MSEIAAASKPNKTTIVVFSGDWDTGAATLEELMESARDLGVEFIVCDLSLNVLGIKKEELRWCDEVVGAGTYVAHATESQVNLFI